MGKERLCDCGETERQRLINCLEVTQSKVDATTKKTKAPAATAGVENLGPAFGKKTIRL